MPGFESWEEFAEFRQEKEESRWQRRLERWFLALPEHGLFGVVAFFAILSAAFAPLIVAAVFLVDFFFAP